MTLEIKKEGNNVVGILEGRLDTLASTQFARDIEPLLDMADKNIILDCEKLDFISSSGLRLFLSIRKQTISKGGNVTITNVNEEIRKVFTITGFSSLFTFS